MRPHDAPSPISRSSTATSPAGQARLAFRLRIALDQVIAIGPGKVQLLDAVRAKDCTTGGATTLPDVGEQVIALYRYIERTSAEVCSADVNRPLGLLRA